ncbi:hypothetical protein T265_02950 [Opisthorchis viverrini]|uniref:Cytochrome b561 domain-containing protein n=1 Tax=Opisthorchis viverrini TaxID=6198 RepID=A0A075AHW5_OPIVI|nr:hypothetical protein T265_02950 [Opisthorchis viverrini]KER30594.1 hypothetical protein T265_02950 [Opisthorchis viverrini]
MSVFLESSAIWVQVERKLGDCVYLMSPKKGETGRGLWKSFQQPFALALLLPEVNMSGMCSILQMISLQVFGLLCVILAGVRGEVYNNGFDWNDSRKVINFHILFMVLGFVFLYGDSILIYRIFRDKPKKSLKIAHAVLLLLSLLFAAIGVRAAYERRKNAPPMTLYSIHSWLGVIVFVAFSLQWIFGLAFFLIPQTPMKPRSRYLPFHTGFGLFLHCLVVLVCLCGITTINVSPRDYSELPPRALFTNFLGLVIVGFGALVFFLVNYAGYRRIEVVVERDGARQYSE